MKAHDLLSSLTPAEKRALEIVIKKRERNSLFHLYSFLKKSTGAKLEKENLYKAAFNETYTKDKDYLLRNELRLLTNELKTYITEREWKKANEENANVANFWYTKALLSRKLFDIYDGDYPDIYAQSIKDVQLDIAMDLSLNHLNRINQDLPKTLDFESMLLVAEDYYANIKKLAAYKTQVYEHHRMAMLTNMNRLGIALKIDLADLPDNNKLDIGGQAQTVLSKYFNYMTLANSADANSIKYIEQALTEIEDLDVPGMSIKSMKITCYNNLCIMLQEEEEYERACEYGKKTFEASLPDGRYLAVIFGNYLRILSKTGKIKEARKVYEQYKEQFDDPQNFPNIISAMMEGELTVGDADRVLDIAQDMTIRNKINYFSTKMCLIALYYKRKDYRLAENELTNIFQYMRDNEALGYNIEQEPYMFAIRQMVKLARQQKVSKQDITKLKELYQAVPAEMKRLHRRSVLMPWYYEKIEQFIKAHSGK